MDFLTLVLVILSFSLLFALHPDIIRSGDKFRKYIYQLLPALRRVDDGMKTALTLSSLVLFVGIIARIYLVDNRWLLNAMVLALIPPLIHWMKNLWTKSDD